MYVSCFIFDFQYITKAEARMRRARLKRPQSTPECSRKCSPAQDTTRLLTEWLSNKTVGSIQVQSNQWRNNIKLLSELPVLQF